MSKLSRSPSLLLVTVALLALPAAADVATPGAACQCEHTDSPGDGAEVGVLAFVAGALALALARRRR